MPTSSAISPIEVARKPFSAKRASAASRMRSRDDVAMAGPPVWGPRHQLDKRGYRLVASSDGERSTVKMNNPIGATLAAFGQRVGGSGPQRTLDAQQRLDGTTCLITGASSGLGKAL